MTRSIYTKWIIGTVSLLLIIACVCFLWDRYTTVKYEKSVTETVEVGTQKENQKGNTDNDEDQTEEAFDPNEIGRKIAEAEGKNRVIINMTELPPKKSEIQQIGVVENIKKEKTTQADTKVSPYGFGPYPEIPADCPYPIEWNFPGSDAEHELMQRVAIKLWTQGIETMGAEMEDGLVYPNYIDTVYISWGDTTDDDNNPIQYIKDLGGYPPACLRIVENNIARLGERGTMTTADIPSDVTVKLYDEAGIDPYSFLDLPK